MLHHRFHKITAFVLIAAICCAFAIPASATNAEALIYLPDLTELALFYQDGAQMREVFNPSSNTFTKSVVSFLFDIIKSVEEPAQGANMLNADLDELLYPISFTAEGVSRDPHVSGARSLVSPFAVSDNSQVDRDNLRAILAAAAPKYSAQNLYIFNYDWRVSPLQNAQMLAEYIDAVLEKTGAERVALLAGGYGGIVANTYLCKMAKHAAQSVCRCVFLDSYVMGSSLIGDIMSGKFIQAITKRTQVGNPFEILKPTDENDDYTLKDAIATYMAEDSTGIVNRAVTMISEDADLSALLTTLILTIHVSVISQEGVYTDLVSGISHLAVDFGEEIMNHGLRFYLRNMPGLWALVPAEDYDAAVQYLFGDQEPNQALLDQIEAYRAVQLATAETFELADAAGIALAVVAGYKRQILPLTGTPEEQSDSIAATRYAAPGVTTNDVSEKARYEQRCSVKRHQHVSPDGLVDASTCFLPEQTWLIRFHRHMRFETESAAAFVAWLLTCSGKPTVHTNELYPQYLTRSLITQEISAYRQADSPFDFVYGDLDGDGSVSAADARLALRCAVGLDMPDAITAIAADVNNDDYISAEDARLILRFAVGLDEDFPVERI